MCAYDLLQVMNEVTENGIHVYTGEIDEEDDSSDIRNIRVCTRHTDLLVVRCNKISFTCFF